MIKLNIRKFIKSIPSKLREYKRILKIARKPNKQEFMKIAKITGLGAAIVGLSGFLIQSIRTLVSGFV